MNKWITNNIYLEYGDNNVLHSTNKRNISIS